MLCDLRERLKPTSRMRVYDAIPEKWVSMSLIGTTFPSTDHQP